MGLLRRSGDSIFGMALEVRGLPHWGSSVRQLEFHRDAAFQMPTQEPFGMVLALDVQRSGDSGIAGQGVFIAIRLHGEERLWVPLKACLSAYLMFLHRRRAGLRDEARELR